MANGLNRLERTILLAAFWPVWWWYLRRATDGADEPWQILAAAGALFFLRDEPGSKETGFPRVSALLGLMIYILSFPLLPPLARAAIAIATAVLSAIPLRRIPPAGFLLLFLSLPLFSTLDFLFSYPLRRLSAALAIPLFQCAGFDVGISGNTFVWNGQAVLIDAPCSGVRMLYTALLLSAFLGIQLRLRWGQLFLLIGAAMSAALSANVFRSASLFFVEARPFLPLVFERFEAPLHSGVGLLLFGGGGIPHHVDWPAARHRPQMAGGLTLMFRALLIFLSLSAAVLPLWPSARNAPPYVPASLPPLAMSIVRQESLTEAPLESRDARFAEHFPGTIRRFRGAAAELLVRSVQHSTRFLHPSADCFRGLGYDTRPLPSDKDAEGNLWGCFAATRGDESLHVCEHIVSGHGDHWSDVSHWFWSSTLHPSSGPWTAMTKITRAAVLESIPKP